MDMALMRVEAQAELLEWASERVGRGEMKQQ